MPGPRPQLVALLLCDRAFQEAGNLKWHVSGCFDTIHVTQLPTTYPELQVFVALSDFTGNAMVEAIIRDQEGTIVKAVRGEVPATPLGLFQAALPFPEVTLNTAGVYTLELLTGKDLVALRSFHVQSVAVDPERESEQAEQIAEQHKAQLIRDVRAVWDEHPDAEPIGLIATPDATQMPWFRRAFEPVFGSPPPQGTLVAVVDPDTLRRLMGSDAARAEEWLAALAGERRRAVRVAIVTRNGYRFARFPLDSPD